MRRNASLASTTISSSPSREMIPIILESMSARPRCLVACLILRMEKLEINPPVVLYLFKCDPHIIAAALVPVLESAIGARYPHKLRDRLSQHPPVLLAFPESLLCPLLFINISTGA